MFLLKERNRVLIDGEEIDITHPDKVLWPSNNITKLHYIKYLIDISPYLLPFLKDRHLTTIRYPNGVGKDFFYQKSCPDYAPKFIETNTFENVNYIIVENLATLVWLGNQGAIDFHVPSNTIYSSSPLEIVFDLDPPSRNEFILAVEAALTLKELLDKLELKSFVKTSGNKGLQVYIPLPNNEFSYNQTRSFTELLAGYLVQMEPKWFTVERLKKNRGNRIYIDYLQHAPRKTMIAPYSARGTEDATVATPLYWHEINNDLNPSSFTIEKVPDRIKDLGCPFSQYMEVKKIQNFHHVVSWLESQ